MIIGQLGDDENGRFLLDQLRSANLHSLVVLIQQHATGSSILHYDAETLEPRLRTSEAANANLYDLRHVRDALTIVGLTESDVVYLPSHALVRQGARHWIDLLSMVAERTRRLVVDLVPSPRYRQVADLELALEGKTRIAALIADTPTLEVVFGASLKGSAPSGDRRDRLAQEALKRLAPRFLLLRDGDGDISRQSLYRIGDSDTLVRVDEAPTPPAYLDRQRVRTGIGDRLTAEFLSAHWEDLE